MTALAPIERPSVSELAQLAVLSLPSPHSRRAYSRHIAQYAALGRPLSRDGLQAHIKALRESGAGPVTVNQAVAAVRLLAREAYARGLIGDSELYAIQTVKGVRAKGVRMGNWLEIGALRSLIDAALSGVNGKRNAAVIACLAGCGLRRDEVAGLTWEQWRRRSGRWVWLDIRGKGDKVRSVPCPAWVARLVNEWREEQTNGR